MTRKSSTLWISCIFEKIVKISHFLIFIRFPKFTSTWTYTLNHIISNTTFFVTIYRFLSTILSTIKRIKILRQISFRRIQWYQRFTNLQIRRNLQNRYLPIRVEFQQFQPIRTKHKQLSRGKTHRKSSFISWKTERKRDWRMDWTRFLVIEYATGHVWRLFCPIWKQPKGTPLPSKWNWFGLEVCLWPRFWSIFYHNTRQR